MSYNHPLNDDDKRELLRIARATLREFLVSGLIPPGKPHRDQLCLDAAVFVILNKDGKLRGCVGTHEASKPVYRAIQEMATAAASHDPRFSPVTRKELDEIDIEISVLGEFREVASPSEIELGKHGLIINTDDEPALLLPQVPIENNWDAAEFFAQTCLKAKLPKQAWEGKDCIVRAFEAQVFSDKTHPRLAPGR